MSRSRRKGGADGTDPIPRTDRPSVGTLRGIDTTLLGRLIAFLPSWRDQMRYMCGATTSNMHWSLEQPLHEFERAADGLLKCYSETIAFISGDVSAWPHKAKSPGVAFWVDHVFYAANALTTELQRRVSIDRAETLDFCRYCLATAQAARHRDPDGIVTVFPVL